MTPRVMRHPWRPPLIRAFAIPWLFLQPLSSWQEVSPFLRVPVPMLKGTEFLWKVANFYPHLDYFFCDFLKLNLNLRNSRAPFEVLFGNIERFGGPSTRPFELATVKILQIAGDVTEDLIFVLNGWNYKPIVIADDDRQCARLRAIDVLSISNEKATPQALVRLLASCVYEVPFDLESGLSTGVQTLRNNAALYSVEFGDEKVIDTDHFVWPTKLLLHRRYRARDLSGFRQRGKQAWNDWELFDRLLDIEYTIGTFSFDPTFAPQSIKTLLETKANVRTPDLVLTIAEQIEPTASIKARNGIIVDVPCINPKTHERLLGRRVTLRVNQLFYRAWSGRSPEPPQRPLKEQERQDFEALLKLWDVTEDFFLASLAVYANDEQAAVISVPKLDSRLFRMLERVKKAFRTTKLVVSNGKRKQVRNTTVFIAELEAFGDELAAALPSHIVRYLADLNTEIRIVSDLPVEWLRIDGVPLCRRTKVTRIPRTPGNGLLLYASQASQLLRLGPREAESLLIINCLAHSDHLAGYPLRLSAELKAAGIPHNYIHVKSFREYQEALNRFKPFLVMHVGHGTFDVDSATCVLCFGDEVADIAQFDEQIAVPEVVLFGACDTAQVGTEDTAGRAYLGWGSRAVLASMMEVQADLTMMLFYDIATTLWRILRTQNRRSATWSDVVFSALTRSTGHEIVVAFRDEQELTGSKSLTQDVLTPFAQRWDNHFVSGDTGDAIAIYRQSADLLIEVVAERAPEQASELRTFIQQQKVLPHSLLYTHFGMPDSILIGKISE